MTEQNKRFLVIGGIIVVAILSRLLPHPLNFTPIAAIALFAGAYFTNKKWALAVPILAMFFSDVILHALFLTGHRAFPGFYPDMIFVYSSFAVVVGIGMTVGKRVNFISVISGSLLASVVFFLVTNFGSWLTLSIYPKNFFGLIEAYVAGIPFFRWTMLGDLVYSGLFFGIFETILSRKPQWKTVAS